MSAAGRSFGAPLLSLPPSVKARVSQTLATNFPSLEAAWSRLPLRVSVLVPVAAGQTATGKFAPPQKAEEGLHTGAGTEGKPLLQYFVVLHFLWPTAVRPVCALAPSLSPELCLLLKGLFLHVDADVIFTDTLLALRANIVWSAD